MPSRAVWALLILALVPAAGRAADVDASAIEPYLSGRYFEIEFVVFERSQVTDFSTGENLSLDRPRSLPNGIRTQRLDAQMPWAGPIDGLTRLCLTYPTLTYEWETETTGDLPDAPVGQSGRPVPTIHPYLEPDPLLDFLARLAAFERGLDERADRWQPVDDFLLAREAGRIARSGTGRVLFHGRWLQNVPERETPDPILIHGGEQLTVPWPVSELVGAVGVTLGRYLHFRAELYLHGPGFGLLPTGAAMNPDGTAELQVRPLPGPRYMVLSESRRMRSGELHYLDHPKLGVLVRIDPVALPADLLEAYEAFQQHLD
ncbi:MAG: CsiV family protein [Pseudomonadales bacterium]